MVSDESKSRLFDWIVEIVPRIGKDEALALAVVRVLANLRRKRDLAVRFGEKRNMQRLFVMVKQLAGKTSEKLQSSVMLVLRHIVEDEATVRQIMQTEIKYFFTNRQQRHHDTSSYLRSLSHIVIRDPDLFVKVTNETVKMKKFASDQRPQQLMLRDEFMMFTEKSDVEGHEKPKQPAQGTEEDSSKDQLEPALPESEADEQGSKDKECVKPSTEPENE